MVSIMLRAVNVAVGPATHFFPPLFFRWGHTWIPGYDANKESNKNICKSCVYGELIDPTIPPVGISAPPPLAPPPGSPPVSVPPPTPYTCPMDVSASDMRPGLIEYNWTARLLPAGTCPNGSAQPWNTSRPFAASDTIANSSKVSHDPK